MTIRSEITRQEAVTQTAGAFVKQVVFLTVESPRTPLREETLLHRRNSGVDREPLGDLQLVYELFMITSEVTLQEASTESVTSL